MFRAKINKGGINDATLPQKSVSIAKNSGEWSRAIMALLLSFLRHLLHANIETKDTTLCFDACFKSPR